MVATQTYRGNGSKQPKWHIHIQYIMSVVLIYKSYYCLQKLSKLELRTSYS